MNFYWRVLLFIVGCAILIGLVVLRDNYFASLCDEACSERGAKAQFDPSIPMLCTCVR